MENQNVQTRMAVVLRQTVLVIPVVLTKMVSVVPTLIFAVQKRMYVMKSQESVVYLTHMDLLTCPKKSKTSS